MIVMVNRRTTNVLNYAKPEPPWWRSKEFWYRALAGAGIGTVLVIAVMFLPDILFGHRDEIDIRSGRIRQSDRFLWWDYRRVEGDSPVSAVLAQGEASAGEPEWRTVNTFSGFSGVSPNYIFHGAIAQTREMEQIWRLAPFTEDAKRESAKGLLERWQADDDYFGASEYLRMLNDAVDRTPRDREVSMEALREALTQPSRQ